MTHQLMPRAGHGPDIDDCLALSAYWDEQSKRPEANDETILVCAAEAKHWRGVAGVIRTLTQATPCPAEDPRRRLFRAGQENVRRFLRPARTPRDTR